MVVPFLGTPVIAAALLSRDGTFDCHVTVSLNKVQVLALNPDQLGRAASMT